MNRNILSYSFKLCVTPPYDAKLLSMIVWCVLGAVVAPSWQVAVSGAVVCAELNICGSVVEPRSSSSQSATDHLMSSHNHHFRHGTLDDQTASL